MATVVVFSHSSGMCSVTTIKTQPIPSCSEQRESLKRWGVLVTVIDSQQLAAKQLITGMEGLQ